MTRQSTKSSERSPKSASNSAPRRPWSTRFARSIPRSSKSSTASCELAATFRDDGWLVLRQIFAAFEDLLDLAVYFFETERQLGRDRVDATIDADRLHALQELDIEE